MAVTKMTSGVTNYVRHEKNDSAGDLLGTIFLKTGFLSVSEENQMIRPLLLLAAPLPSCSYSQAIVSSGALPLPHLGESDAR